MHRGTMLVGMLAASLPLAVLAGAPPSLDRYSINLGVVPGVPGFVPGQMPFWIDTSDTSVNAFGLPRPVSDQSRFPVSTLPASGAPGTAAATPSVVGGNATASAPSGLSGVSALSLDPAGNLRVAGSVVDSNSAAFQGVAALTPGTPAAAQRSLGYVCTTGGPATLTLANGSSITLTLTASSSFQTLPFAVTNVVLGSGTVGTFWNLL